MQKGIELDLKMNKVGKKRGFELEKEEKQDSFVFVLSPTMLLVFLPVLLKVAGVLLLRLGGIALVGLGGLAVLAARCGGTGTGVLCGVGVMGSIAFDLAGLDSTEKNSTAQ